MIVVVLLSMVCSSGSTDVEQRGFEQLASWLKARGASSGLSLFDLSQSGAVRGLKLAEDVADGDDTSKSLDLRLITLPCSSGSPIVRIPTSACVLSSR